MKNAPEYIHKLIDLAWNGASQFEIHRHATVGETWSAGYEGGKWFTVDLDRRYHMEGEESVQTLTETWTVTIPQPQPPVEPALVLTLDEYVESEGAAQK